MAYSVIRFINNYSVKMVPSGQIRRVIVSDGINLLFKEESGNKEPVVILHYGEKKEVDAFYKTTLDNDQILGLNRKLSCIDRVDKSCQAGRSFINNKFSIQSESFSYQPSRVSERMHHVEYPLEPEIIVLSAGQTEKEQFSDREQEEQTSIEVSGKTSQAQHIEPENIVSSADQTDSEPISDREQDEQTSIEALFENSGSEYLPSENDNSNSASIENWLERVWLFTGCSGIAINLDSHDIEIVPQSDSEGQERSVESRGGIFCLYCHSFVTHFPRHLTNKHGEEKKVAELKMLPPKSNARRSIIAQMRQEGRRTYHSINNKSFLIGRRSNKSNTMYTPCPSCKGLFSKSTLHRHYKYCTRL